MKSKVSEENIEEFLESFNPLFDDQIINDIDKSNKRIWNSIESKVNLVQSESLGSSNKVTKVMWYRPYYLFFTLLISIGLCGLFFFNKSNVINAPENLPQTTFIPTTTNEPKRTIQNIDDLKPFASARIQELTDLSQNQIQDAVEKMKTDPNFALNDLAK